MENGAASPEPGRRRIPRWPWVTALIVGIIAVLAGAPHVYLHFKIKSELSAIRKAGFPATLQELDDYYPTPPVGKNAADIYLAAFAKFAEGTGSNSLPVVGEGKLPPRGEPLPEDMKSAISSYLAANAQALQLLHKAAALEQCRFPVDFSQGFATRLEHVAKLRQAARLLHLEALMKTEEGKPDEASAAITASLAVGRSLRNEPIIISQLVRMATDAISLTALERALSRTPLPETQLGDLSEALLSEEDSTDLARALAGERCMGSDAFGNMPTQFMAGIGTQFMAGIGGPDLGSGGYFLYKVSGIEAADHLTYLRLMEKHVSAASGPADLVLARSLDTEEAVEQTSRLCIATRMFVPCLVPCCERELERIARLRAPRAGVAVERFRKSSGRLPDTLDELVPAYLKAVPLDPFDGKPLRYKKMPKGFVVYSVGSDLNDDGGAEHPTQPNGTSDITFIVER